MTLEEIEAQLSTVACLGGQGKTLAKKCQELIEKAVSPDNSEIDPFEEDRVLDYFSCTTPEELDELDQYVQENADTELVVDTTSILALIDRYRPTGAQTWGAPIQVNIPIAELREQFAAVIDQMADEEDAKTKKALLKEAAARLRAYELPGEENSNG